ncbi:hypothetical protein COV17_00670 [Candidatus Woesearchaeota archaeon CG10_big_fil_rev_8_21_14_0_10_36_11]|nr:MAG: hypothetical protein COV17_00670 [Candidatus Woesearchaeota archaeon CG10_big_fil_rev_8_21_14_0_10_36_11]
MLCMKRGTFIVIDGLDGVGKGVFLDTLAEEARNDGKRVFDVHKFWEENDFHPDVSLIIGKYDVVLTSEPTFIGAGRHVRTELIAKNGRRYSPESIAQAYALDRMILYESFILPLLEAGIDVFQSRSFSTSIVYQHQSALDEGRAFSVEDILAIPGNAFCLKHPMNFLIIPTIQDVQEAIRRAESREKDDDCVFENLEFQLKLKSHYESAWFRTIFERIGTTIISMDAGKTIEHSKQQMRDFYKKIK